MTTVRPAIDAAARAAIAMRTEALFRASGAFREGHFQLKSGRHGDAYVEKFAVLSDPAATSELCEFWAADVRDRDGAPMVELVAGPTTGGVILAFETGRQLGVRSLFAEEVRDDDGTTRREFRRGFRIEPGERVLLVDDILTTGGSLLAMIPAVEAMGGEIVECAVLVDRGGGRTDAHLPDDRTRLPAPLALAAGPADLRPGPGHVSAMRGRHAPARPRQQRDRRLIRGSADPERLRGHPRDRHRRDRRRGADPRRATSGPIAARPPTPTSRRASSSRSTHGR